MAFFVFEKDLKLPSIDVTIGSARLSLVLILATCVGQQQCTRERTMLFTSGH